LGKIEWVLADRASMAFSTNISLYFENDARYGVIVTIEDK